MPITITALMDILQHMLIIMNIGTIKPKVFSSIASKKFSRYHLHIYKIFQYYEEGITDYSIA
ncbi:9591_t:CDS:2 [Funneliformis mosseae]|uniref:9591_t:CDS:1 n=1 Tax=Funneliformis mosseae TaxID=27381 RepID=A0A9N8V0F2_FUNMO|nr:9591_t:CDS:2 [Funneliformis mosseae]